MSYIVPAILEETLEGFEEKTSALMRVAGVERIQVDFADGVFVPHRSVPASEIDPLNPAFQWEAHLMVNAPDDFLDYQIAAFSTIIIHYEAYPNAAAVHAALQKIARLGLVPGLAFNPETDVKIAAEFASEAKQYTLLSVHPGFQGGMFMPESIERLKILKNTVPDAIIEVDGGVTASTIKPVSDTGVDLIVIGHAIFESGPPQANFDALNSALTG